jgi:hypothetical protein
MTTMSKELDFAEDARLAGNYGEAKSSYEQNGEDDNQTD